MLSARSASASASKLLRGLRGLARSCESASCTASPAGMTAASFFAGFGLALVFAFILLFVMVRGPPKSAEANGVRFLGSAQRLRRLGLGNGNDALRIEHANGVRKLHRQHRHAAAVGELAKPVSNDDAARKSGAEHDVAAALARRRQKCLVARQREP